MRLEDVTMEIRPRTDWEAVDSGLALARRDFWRCWGLWWLALLPVLALIYPLRDIPFLCFALLLWAKWVGCRMVLYQLSRRLFGENPAWSSLWREIPRAWGRRFFYRMIWARCSPWKPLSAAVEELEGLRGEKFRLRMSLITRKGEGISMLLTLVSALGVVWLAFGIFMTGLMFLPESVSERWEESFDPERLFDSHGYVWLLMACIMTACSLMDVFITGAGFGLYVNSRTWIEGWDIELAFKRMANRLKNHALIVLGLLWLCSAADGRAEETSEPLSAREMIEEVKSHEDFTVHKEKYREYASSSSSGSSITPPSGLLEVFQALGHVALGVFLLALLGGIVWLLYRARWMRLRSSIKIVPVEKARVVMGMEVTAASLPEDLLASAQRSWASGDRLLAMSLLYRGSLAWWIDQARVAIQESDTEGDCLRRVTELKHPHETYFQTLTQAWVLGAYAKRFPSQETWADLCQRWPFAGRRSA
jgi:hypothetical protein